MKVILDEQAGFCFGVKRASELLFSEKAKGKVQVYGELIHNRDYLDHLKEKKIETITDFDKLDGDTVVIRAHGIKKAEEEALRAKVKNVVDATCPFVKKIQLLVDKYQKEGYKILILGEHDHPEVVGIKSYAPHSLVIKNLDEIPDYPLDEKILFVSQTTQNHLLFKQIASFLTTKYKNLVVENTICEATNQKQRSAIELAKKVDILIVVGGKNSCNTENLAKVAREYTKVYKIENKNELEPTWFDSAETVGVTAGASTPDYIIEGVYGMLNSIDKKVRA